MTKRSFGKLQLNRETLRNLTTGELEKVVGGTGGCYNTDEWECAATLESACYFCQESATCGGTGFPGNTCQASANGCTGYYGGGCQSGSPTC